jgi:hypothetical protein
MQRLHNGLDNVSASKIRVLISWALRLRLLSRRRHNDRWTQWGRTLLQLAFEYGMALPGLRKLYTDSLMDIWELPDLAPYFQVNQSGPCTLMTMLREDVTAECIAPATLIRRELLMPGWRVTVNDTASAAAQQNGIFQRSPASGSQPCAIPLCTSYVDFGWAAAIVGMAGLIWQVILIGRSRRRF